jgi:hypothetical protein
MYMRLTARDINIATYMYIYNSTGGYKGRISANGTHNIPFVTILWGKIT